MSQDELEALKKASEGLLYPSETDAPFDVFCWVGKGGGLAKDEVIGHVGKGKKLEEVTIDGFFSELEGTEQAERFGRLRQVLESTLTGVQVFRVGAIRIDVYLVGKGKGGDWMGVHTVSVET